MFVNFTLLDPIYVKTIKHTKTQGHILYENIMQCNVRKWKKLNSHSKNNVLIQTNSIIFEFNLKISLNIDKQSSDALVNL